VTAVEKQTRLMETRDLNLGNLRILIISPPTDVGIKILAEANSKGKTHLLCFSPRIKKIAEKYLITTNASFVKVCVNRFFGIPFNDDFFDAFFANCFFDFCAELDFDKTVAEIKRVLKADGNLIAVYMNFPSDIVGWIWRYFFTNFSFLSQGCRPVDIKPALLKK